jgi:hypothetical protein
VKRITGKGDEQFLPPEEDELDYASDSALADFSNGQIITVLVILASLFVGALVW